MRARWIALAALGLALVLGGCLSWLPSDDEAEPLDPSSAPANGSGNDTAGETGDQGPEANRTSSSNETREDEEVDGEEEAPEPEPPLPTNVTMAGADVVTREDDRVVFAWNGTITPSQQVRDGRTVTELSLPPGTALRINATLSWDDPNIHLVPQMNLDQVEWCSHVGFLDPRGSAELRTETTQATCTVRPDPRPGWETWQVGARYVGIDGLQVADREASFQGTIEVSALEASFSDIPEAGSSQPWPPLGEAPIRPGVKIGTGGCTANFVFQSPDEAHRYVGTAAHCFDEHGVGTMLDVAGIPDAGRITYCSWGSFPNSTGPGCRFPGDGTTDEGPNADDDFTLVEIRPDLHDLVHPALLHWGGPIGLATEVGDGARVVGYGNSTTRDVSEEEVPGPADPTRGYVAGQPHNWSTSVNLLPPGVPGDSGSPVLVGDGRALGVVKTLGASCQRNGSNLLSRGDGLGPINPAANGVSNLAPMLEALHERTNLTVQLATWPLLQQPDFPQSPADPSPAPVSCLGGPPPSPRLHAGAGQDT